MALRRWDCTEGLSWFAYLGLMRMFDNIGFFYDHVALPLFIGGLHDHCPGPSARSFGLTEASLLLDCFVWSQVYANLLFVIAEKTVMSRGISVGFQ
jgi:hypothetical protein